jgi:hypothetical protein
MRPLPIWHGTPSSARSERGPPAGRLAFAKNGYFVVYVIFDDGIEITRVSGGDDDWLR